MSRRDHGGRHRSSRRARRAAEEAGRPDQRPSPSWERALMGALLGQPLLIRPFAAEHPPSWFADEGALAVMRALYCLSRCRDLTVEDLIEALDRHDALEQAGGRDGVQALVAPRPELDAARVELEALRRRLPPIDEDEVVREAARVLGEGAADGCGPVTDWARSRKPGL